MLWWLKEIYDFILIKSYFSLLCFIGVLISQSDRYAEYKTVS